MAGGDDTPKLPPKERGTDGRGTEGRLTRDPPAPSADEAARAQAIVDLRDKLRADVEGLIKLGERLQKEFVAAGQKHPLIRRAAASELLRVYKALQDFESALPRPGGILMQRTPFHPKPVPWPNRPRSLSQVAPFSDANVREWRIAVADAGPQIPARTPRTFPAGPPKVIKKAADDSILVLLIKVPGMSLAHAAGKTILMTKVLRALSHQALSEKVAAAIAPKLDIWKYLVLGYGESQEYKIKTLEGFEAGYEYNVKLKKEFLADAQKLTKVPLGEKQRITRDLGNGFSREYLPDNSEDEHFWYALSRMKNTRRDPNSGHKPGEVVSSDGIMFVEPGFGESTYFAPDGRLYVAKQASLRDQQLEAVRIGVVNSAGGVILGWAVVALGVAAAAAPAAIGAASEALGSVLLGSEAAGTASFSALSNSILYSRFAVWLGANWHLVLAEGTFYYSLGNFAINFNVRQFVARLKHDPAEALKGLAEQLSSLFVDAFEAMSARPGPSPSAREPVPDDEPHPTAPATGRAPAPIDDEPPTTVAPRPTPAPLPPAPPAPAQNPTPPPAPNDVLKRMIANRQLQSGKPANDGRLTNPATQDSLVSDDVAVPVVQKRTGTDDHPGSDDSTTGVTVGSRTPNNRSTEARTGVVTPATGSGRGRGAGGGASGGGSGKGGSGKGAGPGGRGPGSGDGDGPDDQTARARGTGAKKATAQNDNDRAVSGTARITLGARRTWSPVTPPAHPRYANRTASIRQRLQFIADADRRLSDLPPAFRLDMRQRTKLNDWIRGLEQGTITEDNILNPRSAATDAVRQLAKSPVDTLEDTIDKGLSEEFRHQLALATRMTVVSVNRSNNIGDQAADFQALQQGRPRAYPFTTETRDGQLVQFDDFDFKTGQPIESKSISSLVPPGISREVAIHDLKQQMTKQALAVRDNETAQPVRWNVPPDVHQELVDKVWGELPKDLRHYVVVGPPAAPIRVTPTEPPLPPRTPPKKR